MIKNNNTLDEYLLKQTVLSSITEQALSCLFRAILEPVLEIQDSIESDVILKVTNRDMFTGLLTRLEFSEIQYVDYGEDIKGKENLDETDFLLVMTSDFISFLSWKQTYSGLSYVSFTNSAEIDRIIDLLNENADIDLSYLKSKYKTKNLKAGMSGLCINKLVAMLNNTDVVSGDVVDNEDLSEKINYLTKKSRYISHEIKNQLSICDLYSGIIKRYSKNNGLNDDTIKHSIDCIDKSIKISTRILEQLKTLNSKELQLFKTNRLIETSAELAAVYLENKNIKFIVENNVEEEIFVDEILFISVIINLIKNASEAFEDFDSETNWVKISSQVVDDSVSILVSNNAIPISEPEKIFEEGMTTKTTGSGLGLYICKRSIEEQCGQLRLLKSDKDSTIFEIKFCL
ncbi:MAG: ATP-binding protein [Candidatus Gastranaerophilaceae bacterium]